MEPNFLPELFDAHEFEHAVNAGESDLQVYRRYVRSCDLALAKSFEDGIPIADLVRARANFVDHVLTHAWQRTLPHSTATLGLIAVGGYGRGELHPASDIDIMVLVADKLDSATGEAVGSFLTLLWDIGLEIGHSTRTLAECVHQAQEDITVATNLMESRLIVGSADLYASMRTAVAPDQVWSSRQFFEAKWHEQIQRHQKYHDTAYNLEPNIKESPGGLRDIQMIGWVAKRHFGATTLHDLVTHNFLTEAEFSSLIEGQDFLWRVRFALHVLTGRREDRLLFDFQRILAKQFGFQDENTAATNPTAQARSRAADGPRLGVELFMKQYYRTVMELSRLNEMLLQLFQEAILYTDDSEIPVPINRRFQARKGFIEITYPSVFLRYPFALLEIFLLLQQNPELKGVRASTIRAIRTHRDLIDDTFRADIRCRSLFMEIVKQPRGVTHELRRMNSYGILAAYLPPFARIVGLMQYDLFHVYTVDQHTLFVIRNLRRLTVPEFANELPLCSQLMGQIPKPELLVLAGLFHDIAKGRGGDHSTLGAEEARQFCRVHNLSIHDTELVAWLVRQHLVMSATAQHKDIDDPQVVNEFATAVSDSTRLDYLFLLTVADMRATNPKLWNSWKDSLLRQLYRQTQRAFRRGLENPLDKRERVRETQSLAKKILVENGVEADATEKLWRFMDDEYFFRYLPEEIAWHGKALLPYQEAPQSQCLILIQSLSSRGGTDIFIHAPRQKHQFAAITATFDRLSLNIVEARITVDTRGYTLDTYSVLEHNGEPISSPQRLREIETELRKRLKSTEPPKLTPPRSSPRQLKHFSVPTAISFITDISNQRTIMEVVTTDRPGLLARIAFAMMECDVMVQNAKIATFGAEAADVFFITDLQNRPIQDAAVCERLKQNLISYLDPATETPPP